MDKELIEKKLKFSRTKARARKVWIYRPINHPKWNDIIFGVAERNIVSDVSQKLRCARNLHVYFQALATGNVRRAFTYKKTPSVDWRSIRTRLEF